MNLKQKLTLGIAAIFMVTLTIVGVTYAYFVTRVNGSATEEAVKVTTAKLGVSYGDGTGVHTFTDVLPGTTYYKGFTVTNSESTADVHYEIGVEVTPGTIKFRDGITAEDKATYPTLPAVAAADGSLDDIFVTLVEVDKDTVFAEGDTQTSQEALATAFTSPTATIQAETNLYSGTTVGETNYVTQILGTTQTISGLPQEQIDGGQTVVKKYIVKIEYKSREYDQSADMNAELTTLMNIYNTDVH